MKEPKELETRLRSWKPRRPSARLEREIFGAAGPIPDVRALLRVLVPAGACLILSMAMLNQPDRSVVSLAAGPEALMAMSLSNQNYAAYLPGSFACEANRLDTFRWTNGGASPSSPSFISPATTND